MMSQDEFLEFKARMDAIKLIIKLNNPDKYADLSKKDFFWVPEEKPQRYSYWVNANYEANPNDAVSLSIYSLLVNIPMEQLRKQMLVDLGGSPETR